ncbi:MAG: dehydrogenase E1 component subunit alpha/beta [Bacteroidia bacterium]|nr:dehydrogenase E1 component subunit alpha/beta [Bacteroidia bacterium]
MVFDSKKKNPDLLIKLYRELLFPRMIEEKMLNLLRQGKISKWFSGIGQEAISVGAALALDQNDYILPMHRNLGIFTGRGIPFDRLFAQWQGKESGFSKGRERSFHFGTQDYKIIGMISHLGPQMGVADGIALAHKIRQEKQITAVFTGDGGSSEGDFHESLNVAAVWDLPVLFIVENNGYGLSTPSSEQFRFKSFTDKAAGYGIQAQSIDGNNILEVYDAITAIRAEIIRKPGPWLLECNTFRMRGHEEASGTKYVPTELLEAWAKKDPLQNYRQFLLETGLLTESSDNGIREEFKTIIEKAVHQVSEEPAPKPDTAKELGDVYKPFVLNTPKPDFSQATEMRFVDAIAQALDQAMERHPDLVLMGQDIADYGGVFKVTDGLYKKFGKQRVRNTPLCESAILGAGLGLSIAGMKAMVEMQFADFVSEGITQITNNLAKSHYRWGQHADVVVRMPTGAGVAAGPFHSQSNEAWFTHVPGLKIFYPAFPDDAKGLLLTAFEDPNPVMFFEHKALYRSLTGTVPSGYYAIEPGKAALRAEGNQVTIVTYGMGVHWALAYLKKNPAISADLLDLRTLVPFDEEAIYRSVRKTGKAIVLHEDTLTGGFGGEIAARITENCFEYLDAPVRRSASIDTPVPFQAGLENNFLASARFEAQIEALLSY